LVIVAVAVATLLATGSALLWKGQSPTTKLYRARSRVGVLLSEGQLAGRSPDEVKAFLDENSIEHSGYMLDAEASDLRSDEDRVIMAIFRDVASDQVGVGPFRWQRAPITYSIQVFFVFDRRHRLAYYRLQKVATGP
jgi:hypothetical protein